MQQQVKVVIAQSVQGEQQQYFIFKNVKLGQGGFGVVKKAIAAKDKSRVLAVKIVPYDGDKLKRKKIEREVDIIRLLPDHPNLVKIVPIKCFSEKNFYIFMEMCQDGTLEDIVRSQGMLEQEKILDIFWQLMSGYRVLWKSGIVHQDLKLANVLIKKNVLKITDFGFSLLAEKYVPSLTREGTLQYMPIQKLTEKNYVADQLSDIYSLGVIMFETMTKMHPYINQKGIRNHAEFTTLFKNAQLIKPRIVSSFSAPLQGLYDLVLRMVAKRPNQRANCEEIYDYLDNDKAFQSFRQKEAEFSKQLVLNIPAMTITEQTSAFAIPFSVSNEQQQNYIEKIKAEKQIKKNEENIKIIKNIEQWVLSLRLVVYYFDRLARRLFIQKLRGDFNSQKNHSFNKTILSCLLAEAKITRWILKQFRFAKQFRNEDIYIFKNSEEGIRSVKIVRKDEEYIREQITDNLKRTTQLQIQQQKKLIELAQKQGFEQFVAKLKTVFIECITKKAQLIRNKRDLITIKYMIDSLQLLNHLPRPSQKLQLQGYFHDTETRSKESLFIEIDKFLTTSQIPSFFEEQIYSEEEPLIEQ